MFTRPVAPLLKPVAGAAVMTTAPSTRLSSLSTAQRAFSTCQPVLARSGRPTTMLEDKDDGFGFVRHNSRPPKPRKVGVTEIRGPYYSAMGANYLKDVFDT